VNEPRGKIRTEVVIGVLIALAVVVAIGAVVLVDTTGEKGSGLSQAYDLDAVKLAEFDPNLILYAETGAPIPTGFDQSRALTLDAGGRVYVAGDEAIRVLSKTGNLERVIGLSGEPRCVAVSAGDNIYVGVKDHVEVFDTAGQRLASWEGLGERAFLTSIAVSKNDVFVADAGNAVVLRYDTTGELVGRIGEKDPERNIPGIHVPSPYFDLAVAPDGLLRVVSPGRLRIEAYTFDGDLEFWWGENSMRIEGFCGCCNPVNFAMLPDGSYITAEKGLIRIKVYEPDGSFKGVVAGPEQLVEGGAARVFESVDDAQASGFDVAVDADGRVYVLDTIENTVRVFVEKGKD
jgi:DNA-binding beta-propeller fold protein YncE